MFCDWKEALTKGGYSNPFDDSMLPEVELKAAVFESRSDAEGVGKNPSWFGEFEGVK
jgi:hypothetical protein